MTENQYRLRRASFRWMQQHADQFTHAVTLTLKPYRIVRAGDHNVRQVLTVIEAQTTFRQFLKRLNASLFGNAAKRRGKSVTVIPLLDGQAAQKLLHFHCGIGGFPVGMDESLIEAKIASAWHATAFGNEQIDIQPFKTAGWLTYGGKEIGVANVDVIDWLNVHLSAASLT